MSSLFGGFFSREAGQQRRAWLDDKSQSVADRLNYALGPQLAPQLGRMAGLAAMFSPGQDVVDAQRAGQDLMDWRGPLDAAGDASTLAAAFGSMLLPGGVSSYRQGFDDLVDAGVRAHKSGDLHIFAGPKAANADHAAKARAEALEAAGADRADILQDTGWFRGEDGMWRFEIDDRPASLNLSVADDSKPLSEALRHPDLHAAYPQLAKTEIGLVDLGGPKILGGYVRPDGDDASMIWLKPDASDKLNFTLHETQHAIQNIEGFAGGGSFPRLRPGTPSWRLFVERLYENVPETTFEALSPALRSQDSKQITQAIQEYDLDDAAFDAQEFAEREAYRRLSGEVEARNVQARHGMLPEERRQIPPWCTQDTPSRHHIIEPPR